LKTQQTLHIMCNTALTLYSRFEGMVWDFLDVHLHAIHPYASVCES
jgi:hypothetical protein